MSNSPEKIAGIDPGPGISMVPDSIKQRRHRRMSWTGHWSTDRVDPNEALKQLVQKMRIRPVSKSGSTTASVSESEPESEPSQPTPPDYSILLSDELLVKVLNKVSDKNQHFSNSLVCKRWCLLSGKLVKSIKLLDWEFLESGRLTFRFPNLVDINIAHACIKPERNSGILLSNKLLSIHLSSKVLENDVLLVIKHDFLAPEWVDQGLRILSEGCRNLTRIVLMNAGEKGLISLGEECEWLQEMELYYCGDFALKGIEKCRNLQILKLVGSLTGVYESVVTDIGMTILAQGCRRLVKLELVGCEGSYDGIKAIGQCCQMLEEFTLCDHRMEGGWLSALSYCENLKTLRFRSCKNIDENPGSDEHLFLCPTLEELHLIRCEMRDKKGVKALFLVCRNVRRLVIEDCWGMDNSVFAAASIFRNIRSLLLEGCSLLTTEGLESVVLSWKELQRLRVGSCNSIKDSEITPELATLFSDLKELKWRPDSKSLLASSLEGTGIGQKGGRSLKRK